MVSSPTGGEPVVGEFWPSYRRSLCLTRKHALPSILLSGEKRCTYGCGCSGTPVAKRVTSVSSAESNRAYFEKDKRMRPFSNSDYIKLAGEIVADRENTTPLLSTVASPVAQGPTFTSVGGDFSPNPGQCSSLGLAVRG